MSEAERFYPESRTQWREWLSLHHTSSKGVWLVYNRKTSGKYHLSYEEQVEEALCFGWVDSKPAKLDDERSTLYFAPRKPGSGWSKVNKKRVEKLIAAGRMTSAGLAKIEAAKRDGSWSRLDAVERLEVPEDLARALASVENAEANFTAFPRSVKRAILEWIVQAKRPETRAKRVEETARLAGQNRRANQWSP